MDFENNSGEVLDGDDLIKRFVVIVRGNQPIASQMTHYVKFYSTFHVQTDIRPQTERAIMNL
jgi:hypothetical protein